MDWKKYPKGRSTTFLTLYFNPAPVFLDDHFALVKADAHPFFFCASKGMKEGVVNELLRHATSGVID